MDDGFNIERVLKGKQDGGRLENWKRQHLGKDGEYIIWGDCYGDTCGRFADGTHMHTSLVVKHYVRERIVETLNSYYVLGKPRGVDLAKKEKLTKSQLELLASAIC